MDTLKVHTDILLIIFLLFSLSCAACILFAINDFGISTVASTFHSADSKSLHLKNCLDCNRKVLHSILRRLNWKDYSVYFFL